MAKKYDIDIDSYIGDWYSSKRAIKNQISSLGDKEITVRVNSLGGDVNTAIDVSAQFESHGNIICDLFSFNASAATVLTMGAKKVRMHENGMYLIHKALVWIDEWGYMNEDDIEAVIAKLKAAQESSAVVTLNIATMYAKKTGKGIKEILSLMKEEKWLNAQTALEWGFVDELFSGSVQAKKQPDIVEMLNCADLPIPENFSSKEGNENNDELTISRKDFISEVVSGIKNIFHNNKTEPEMEKTILQAALIAAILNVNELNAVGGKVEFTAEEITNIENAISKLNEEKTALKNDISKKDTKIADLERQIENMKKAPGDTTREVNKENDEINNETADEFDGSIVASAKALYDAIP